MRDAVADVVSTVAVAVLCAVFLVVGLFLGANPTTDGLLPSGKGLLREQPATKTSSTRDFDYQQIEGGSWLMYGRWFCITEGSVVCIFSHADAMSCLPVDQTTFDCASVAPDAPPQ